MLNETSQGLEFTQVIEITQNPVFLIALLIIWFLPLIVYIIIGACVSAKTPSGRKLGLMISYANFWIAPAVWFFLQSALILLLIVFPFWTRWIT